MYFREVGNRYILYRDSGAVINTAPKTRSSAMWIQDNQAHYIYGGVHYIFTQGGQKKVYKDPKKRSVFSKDYKPGTYGAYWAESVSIAEQAKKWLSRTFSESC